MRHAIDKIGNIFLLVAFDVPAMMNFVDTYFRAHEVNEHPRYFLFSDRSLMIKFMISYKCISKPREKFGSLSDLFEISNDS